jgi:hypothetical protein
LCLDFLSNLFPSEFMTAISHTFFHLCLGLLICVFPSGLQTKTVYAPLFSLSGHMACLSQTPCWQEVTRLFIMHFYSCHVTSSLLGTNILLSTLFSYTLSLCSSFSVMGQVSHPYKTMSILLSDRYCSMSDPSV